MNSTPLPAPRSPYVPPVLEPLGAWSTLTLQQSIIITESIDPYVTLPVDSL